MFGTLIYNRFSNILTSIDETTNVQIDSEIPFGSINLLEFHDSCKSKDDYHELFGNVLTKSKYFEDIKRVVQETIDDQELFGIVELDSITGNRIYISDGKIWDWNFEFIVV